MSGRDRFEEIVQKMTNRERSAWARAGYPGLSKRDVAKLTPHAGAAIRRLEEGLGRPPYRIMSQRIGA
jgi:hypothetical protein